MKKCRVKKLRNRKRPAIEAGVEGSEQEPKEPRVEELGRSWR